MLIFHMLCLMYNLNKYKKMFDIITKVFSSSFFFPDLSHLCDYVSILVNLKSVLLGTSSSSALFTPAPTPSMVTFRTHLSSSSVQTRWILGWI